MRPPVPVSMSQHSRNQAIFGTRKRISLSEHSAENMMKFRRLNAPKRKVFIRTFLLELGVMLPSNLQTKQMLVENHTRNGKKLKIVHITVTHASGGFFPRLTQYCFLLDEIPSKGNIGEFNRYTLPNDAVYNVPQGPRQSQRGVNKRAKKTRESRNRKPRVCPGCRAQYTRDSEKGTLKRTTRANHMRQMCVITQEPFATGDIMLRFKCKSGCKTLFSPEGRDRLTQLEDREEVRADAIERNTNYIDEHSRFV